MTPHHDQPGAAPLPEAAVQRVHDSFARQGLMAHLGARLAAVESGRVVITLAARAELTQQHGFFHAGATSAIGDTAGGYAAYSLLPLDAEGLTVEFKVNLLAPARGDHLEAVGEVVRAGRTLIVCRFEVTGVTGDDRTVVAIGQQTVMRVDP